MIELNQDLTFEEFRREMQHRVCRYALNSPEVQEALAFASEHSDPSFYRMASQKFQAQTKFQAENPTPTIWSRLVGLRNSLPVKFVLDFAKTAVFVIVTLTGLQIAQDWYGVESVPKQDSDVEAIAQMLGLGGGTLDSATRQFSTDPTLSHFEKVMNVRPTGAHRQVKLDQLSDRELKELSDRLRQISIQRNEATNKTSQSTSETNDSRPEVGINTPREFDQVKVTENRVDRDLHESVPTNAANRVNLDSPGNVAENAISS